MARDLVTEIERCLGSGNAYIRKKAALAALRCLYKVPELVDHFEGRATSLLSDRNHGVLLTGVTLVTEMCRLIGGEPFRKVRPFWFCFDCRYRTKRRIHRRYRSW